MIRGLMTFSQLIELKNKLYEDFENKISKMEFVSEEERTKYYSGFIEGIETFSFHTMLAIMDAEHNLTDKAA
jgi:hypothetical protein